MLSNLKLGGDKHGGGSDELQRFPGDGRDRQEMVDHLHRQIQCLVVQLKVLLQNTHNVKCKLLCVYYVSIFLSWDSLYRRINF